MKPELQSKIDDVTKSLGIAAHARGSIMEVELNWAQLDQMFIDMYRVTLSRHRSVLSSIAEADWVRFYRFALVKRIQYVRESVYGVSEQGYPRATLSKATVIHGAAHTVFSCIGLFKSEDLGYRFIPALPPREWASIPMQVANDHADVIEGLRSRGLVVSEGFPSEFTGTMAYLLLVKEIVNSETDVQVIASSPSKEATANDGMLASIVFQTRNAMVLSYGYDFSPVATPSVVLRRFLGAYMGGERQLVED